MILSIRFAETRWDESHLVFRYVHKRRRTLQRRDFRWASRGRHGQEEGTASLCVDERIGRRKLFEDRRHIPRLEHSTRRRAILKDAFDQSRDV